MKSVKWAWAYCKRRSHSALKSVRASTVQNLQQSKQKPKHYKEDSLVSSGDVARRVDATASLLHVAMLLSNPSSAPSTSGASPQAARPPESGCDYPETCFCWRTDLASIMCKEQQSNTQARIKHMKRKTRLDKQERLHSKQ